MVYCSYNIPLPLLWNSTSFSHFLSRLRFQIAKGNTQDSGQNFDRWEKKNRWFLSSKHVSHNKSRKYEVCLQCDCWVNPLSVIQFIKLVLRSLNTNTNTSNPVQHSDSVSVAAGAQTLAGTTSSWGLSHSIQTASCASTRLEQRQREPHFDTLPQQCTHTSVFWQLALMWSNP